MLSISTAIRAFFSMLTSVFLGGEHFANAFKNIGQVADETSAQYVDSATAERAVKAILIEKRIAKAKAEAEAVVL